MDELSALSLKLQAPVVFAQDAIGVIAEDHPFFAGHFSQNRPHPLCAQTLRQADLVLGIGLRAGTAELSEVRAHVARDMILIGFDDVAEARYAGEDDCVADPKLFLGALLERFRAYERPGDTDLLTRLKDGKMAIRRALAEHNAPHRSEKPIHPGVLMDAMNAVLNDDAVVASDVGNCQQWARTFRRIANPESFMQSGVWNAMSFALPTAIVAKMEFPHRDVVALAGDGAFLMTIGDLPTAVEHGANILMIVLNDGAFGQTLMQQTNIYGHTYGTSFRSPDFAEIANACGAKGIRVTEPRHVEDAVREGLAATRHTPALLDVVVANSPYPKL
jgi:thiamine pyrophosphate-dependent acetolactate synthase large subunit-like protein